MPRRAHGPVDLIPSLAACMCVRVGVFVSVLASFLVQPSNGFFHQPTFLDPVFDEYGVEIRGDRVLEMTALKSTALGYGFGGYYDSSRLLPPATPILILDSPQAASRLLRGRGLSTGLPRSGVPTQPRQPAGYRARGFRPSRLSASAYSPYVSRYDPFRKTSTIKLDEDGEHTMTLTGVSVTSSHGSVTSHRRFRRSANVTEEGHGRVRRQARPINVRALVSRLGQVPQDVDIVEVLEVDARAQSPLPDSFYNLNRHACRERQVIRCNKASSWRTIDGLCNSLSRPKWGTAMQPVRRLHNFNTYFDGVDAPRLTSAVNPRRLLPSPRSVSQAVNMRSRDDVVIRKLSNMVQQWGQFLDHDITATPAHKAPDGGDLRCCQNVFFSESRQIHNDVFNRGPCNPIYIPPNDRYFRSSCMNFARSQPAPRENDCNPQLRRAAREQMNIATAFIDASQVYGSSLEMARRLRLYRHGLLRVTAMNFLPEDVNATCVRDNPGHYCFLAGEDRVNEHPALTTLHTVWHRLHNQMALGLMGQNPQWGDERLYQEARKIVGAAMQHVTYHDWLPIILGDLVMRDKGLSVSGSPSPIDSSFPWSYQPSVNPTIINSFATAAFRFGHTLIPSSFTVGQEKIRLREMFNQPKFILREPTMSLGKFCSGMMMDSVQQYDRFMSVELTDLLFLDRDNVSMDLAALNVQRGRDHGLPSYNEYRDICGLRRFKHFDDMAVTEGDRARIMSTVYDSVDDIDLFTGGISEPSMPGALVGPTFSCIIAQQFRDLKYGDRFWYESRDPYAGFTNNQLLEIKKFSMAKAICQMAGMRKSLAHPFLTVKTQLPQPILLTSGRLITRNELVDCAELPSIDLRMWRSS